jgi:DNA gyrase subunit B
LAGYCKNIYITIRTDGSLTVDDNGRGVPVGPHRSGKDAMEVVYTVLHAGGKFEGSAYKVSGGLHGVGASVTNALSSRCQVESHKNGTLHRQIYMKGYPQGPVEIVGPTQNRNSCYF